MKFSYFTHSLSSCWNHGNVHFQRGLLRELKLMGHDVTAFEPRDAWSRANLVKDRGEAALQYFEKAYPELDVVFYDNNTDLEGLVAASDVVIVHEWNQPSIISAIGRLRARGGSFTLLFHDTHHRAISEPDAIRAFHLDSYDGVLAFGEALAAIYRKWGWGNRVFTWHEAADTKLFRPAAADGERSGLVWIGNWGDGERTAEIETFLLRPAQQAGMVLDMYGVRYPGDALERLAYHGAAYRGWLPNTRVPEIFAQHLVTVHIPRRFYATELPGIPTIRIFEALSCGIPLITSPWHDSEGLFNPGSDYLVAKNEKQMAKHLRAIGSDPALRRELSTNGLKAILARHTCVHRASELIALLRYLENRMPLELA
jgi:spore maturation protein CgeB